MTDILLTNDDGYKSIGFYPLLRELLKKYSVTCVVPNGQRSWISKSITRHNPVNLRKCDLNGHKINVCSGTPADSTQIGMYNILKQKPNLVVSGINIGENVGHARILSSGTVGAAIESAIEGVSSIAASLYIPDDLWDRIDYHDPNNYHIYENAAKITAKVVDILYNVGFREFADVICINIPFKATLDTEWEVAKPFKLPYGRLFKKQGNRFIHRGLPLVFEDVEDTDLKTLEQGKISITPINLDLAALEAIPKLKKIIEDKW
ncbi:MAG: 5'-nucleotidase SurE1 [Candidatus Woesearchaeota archaeon]|nr:5'-nucleotidase SurE1 [Candidatus Woesearchaeota archaeon]